MNEGKLFITIIITGKKIMALLFTDSNLFWFPSLSPLDLSESFNNSAFHEILCLFLAGRY